MTDTIKVPDIGDFKDVPVIEVHVKPGQIIAAEDTLITLESDKATLDVPAPAAGTIRCRRRSICCTASRNRSRTRLPLAR